MTDRFSETCPQHPLNGPIGLDLGGTKPAGTAVNLAAEIVAHRRPGTGAHLTRTPGRIHHRSTGVATDNFVLERRSATRGVVRS